MVFTVITMNKTLKSVFFCSTCFFILFITISTFYPKSIENKPSYFPPSQKVSFNSSDQILLNYTNFHYLIDNHPCDGNSNITAIQIVTSFSGNVEARSAIRRSYPSPDLKEIGVVRVFLLAALKPGQSQVTQEALLHENSRFHDLVQGDFVESYRNLTYKHTMGLKWAWKRCPNSKYVIKMDDDIATDIYGLLNRLRLTPLDSDQLMGYVLKGMKPKRLKANKWFVTEEEFRGNNYPTFLSGWLYVMTLEGAGKLARAAQTLDYFWIDDVFITGLAAKKESFRFVDINTKFTLHPEVIECCIRLNRVCNFVVGPTGGDYDLHLKFSEHAKSCRMGKCKPFYKKKTLESICVSAKKLPTIGRGHAQISLLNLAA